MPDYKQDFLVMGSAEQRVWELAVALCMCKHHLPLPYAPCGKCQVQAGIKLLGETVAK